MEQRDLLKEEIEQLGRVLGKMISKLLGIKNTEEVEASIEILNQEFQSTLDIDIDELLKLDKPALKDYLTDKKFNADHLEQLSLYLQESGQKLAKSKPIHHYKSALLLLDIADETSAMISFERAHQKEKIKHLMNKLKD